MQCLEYTERQVQTGPGLGEPADDRVVSDQDWGIMPDGAEILEGRFKKPAEAVRQSRAGLSMKSSVYPATAPAAWATAVISLPARKCKGT